MNMDVENKKILVYGDFMVDRYVIGNVKRISPEAPIPVIEVERTEDKIGGAGNVVNNIHALGARVTAVTCLGDDEDGKWMISALDLLGADTTYMQLCKDRSTISKTRIVSKNQQFIRIDKEEIKETSQEYQEYLQKNIDEMLMGICVLVLSDYGKGLVNDKTAPVLIAAAKKRGIPVIVDPKGDDYTKYTDATICTPNFKEFTTATKGAAKNEEEIKTEGAALCERLRLDYLLITRSEHGMSLINRMDNSKENFPAQAKEVLDVTGAGDTVVAAIAIGMASGLDMGQCCKFANRAASVVITKFGAATVTQGEILHASMVESDEKIVKIENIATLAQGIRNSGKKIAFTNGCFDLLHAGHLSSLKKAKQLGDILIVGLNSDLSVKRMKGEDRPIVDQFNRACMLGGLAYVDYIVIFEEDTPEKLIETILPDVLVKGADWKGQRIAGDQAVWDHGGRVEFIELEPGLSTTNIIARIKNEV